MLDNGKKNANTKLFVCDECSKGFTTKFSMIRHKITIHNNERSYTCRCGKSFGTLDQKDKHFISKHTSQRPIKCKRGCKKSFATVNARLYHYNIHHDNLRHDCNLCDSSFTSRRLLRNHSKKYHEVSSYDTQEQAKIADKDAEPSEPNKSTNIAFSQSEDRESEESSNWLSFLAN